MPCYIFDFDGTLADTRQGIIATFRQTIERMHLKPKSDEEIADTIGLPLKDAFIKLTGMSEDKADEAVDNYREIFFATAIPLMKLFPGVEETLHSLKERGITMAIASSRGEGSLLLISHNLGIDKYITPNRIYGVERVTNHKPAPDMVNLILKELGESPDATTVIGDTTYDIEMGNNARCRTCGITWGNHSAEKLATAGPSFIINDLRELIRQS